MRTLARVQTVAHVCAVSVHFVSWAEWDDSERAAWIKTRWVSQWTGDVEKNKNNRLRFDAM